MTEAVRTFRISKVVWGKWTDGIQPRHNEQPNKHSWNSRGKKKKVFLLWFCPVAIVHILSVSNFTAAETQVWIPERPIQGITACLWWCHRHRVVTWQWVTKDLFPGLGKAYLFPPTWCEAQSKQKTEGKTDVLHLCEIQEEKGRIWWSVGREQQISSCTICAQREWEDRK